MPGFNKKPTRPASGRTAVALNLGAPGLTAEMVRQELHRPFTAQELAQERARAAWEQRYQQITRSGRAYARSATVARQDGPFAYYAQAQLRAELKYQAQTNQRLAIEKAATQQAVANQTYIRQGSTRDSPEAHHRRMNAHKTARQTRQNREDHKLEVTIGEGIGQGTLIVGQVMVSELAIARLVGTARWLNASRVALAAGRTPGGVGTAVKFGARAGLDIGVQYGGGLMAHNGNFGEAYNEINLTSAFMAGLPGDGLWHSVRNNVVASAFEIKLNLEENVIFAPMPLTWKGGLNFGQKVILGVGADYTAGMLTKGVRPYQLNAHSILARSSNIHTRWLYRQRLMLLTTLEKGSKSINMTSEGVSNIAEDKINKLP